MFHAPITPPLCLTPRAFNAIVAQFAGSGFHEAEVCADLNGAELEWAAFFETEDDSYGGMNERHECCAYTNCTLKGAWAEDIDGNLFAGNRDELAALVGEKAVEAWERYAEEGLNQ